MILDYPATRYWPSERVEKLFPDYAYDHAKRSYAVGIRGYHTFSHALDVIDRVLYFHDEIGFMDVESVLMAALFHDAVYVAGAPAGQNEYRSVDEMLDAYPHDRRDEDTKDALLEARQLIQNTARHLDKRRYFQKWDEALFMDCDMLGFAAPPEIFDKQNRSIDYEFQQASGYTPETYRKGRMIFLAALRGRGVFISPPVRKAFEKKALANIERALADLSSAPL